MISEAEALIVLPLATMKDELRIPSTESSHDDLITGQIVSAVSFVSESTGATGDALLPLRAAIVAAVRSQYNGTAALGESASFHGWMAPFRSYKSE